MTTENTASDWAQYVETIESGYEFMLAYAAQGRETDDPAGTGQSQIRQFLKDMYTALDDLIAAAEKSIGHESLSDYQAFLATMEADAKKARSGIKLVLAQPAISSQLVDNLNVSIHLRALLTDLFLIDEALKLKAKM